MKKTTIIIAVLGVIGAALFFLLIRPAHSQKKVAKNSDPPDPPEKLKRMNLPPVSWPVKMGDYGREILELQAYLNMKDGTELELDGIFGPNTYAAWKNHGWEPLVLQFTNQVEKLLYQLHIEPAQDEIKEYLKTQGIQLI